MKMKKFLTMAAIAAICVPMLTACSDDENEQPNPPHVETPTVEGIFLINSGNSGDQIPGSLTYIGNNGSTTANAFATVNGRVLGNTPNDVLVYGSKLYIVSTDGSFVYGYATAVDTGGALMDGSAIVDCFYNTYSECVNFGRRDVNVYVLA